MNYPSMEEILWDEGWKYITHLKLFEKQNSNGYRFQVAFDKSIGEWWCHIEDDKHRSCGNVYLPSYDTLASLFIHYGRNTLYIIGGQ